jgi:hypothetical protein
MDCRGRYGGKSEKRRIETTPGTKLGPINF